MDKMKMHSPNFAEENIEKLAALFPNCVTETEDENGELKKVIDFDLLRQELSTNIVEGPQERYRLDWPGKREALLTANAPIAKTLRPCREESVNFDTTENLFIEGDNLDALKLLQETYLGKVKVIYIDPPYNTGKDFIYSDHFAVSSDDFLLESGQRDEAGNRLIANLESNGRFHSDWLSMMYSRVKLARNLLKDDGAIFISIDDGEAGNIRELCDEVFGGENFVTNIIWEKRKTRENRRVFSFNHDYVLCYAKNKVEFELARNLLPLTDEALERYSNPDNDPRGDWQSVAITAQAGHGTKSQFYTITTPSGREVDPPSGNCWRVTQPKLQELIEDNRIWFGAEGNNVPRRKLFLKEQNAGLTPHTLWTADEVGTTDSAKRALNDLFDGSTVFDTPKPVELLSRIIQIGTKRNDLILDFFAGTSPAAHAVMRLNSEDNGKRKFIMVQLPEVCDENSEAYKVGYHTIAEISKERIRRAGKRIKEEKGLTATVLDVGFRVLKIDSSNMADIYYRPDEFTQDMVAQMQGNIKADRSSEDILFQALLDWGVDLTLPVARETIGGNEVFFVDANALAACFAKNGEITEDFCKELAKRGPLRVVFRDAGFKDDSVKINIEQIFKLMSPHTEVKTI
jgi:adenine-specific DNA-methyltransferase